MTLIEAPTPQMYKITTPTEMLTRLFQERSGLARYADIAWSPHEQKVTSAHRRHGFSSHAKLQPHR